LPRSLFVWLKLDFAPRRFLFDGQQMTTGLPHTGWLQRAMTAKTSGCAVGRQLRIFSRGCSRRIVVKGLGGERRTWLAGSRSPMQYGGCLAPAPLESFPELLRLLHGRCPSLILTVASLYFVLRLSFLKLILFIAVMDCLLNSFARL
jgi:hypothetical protein